MPLEQTVENPNPVLRGWSRTSATATPAVKFDAIDHSSTTDGAARGRQRLRAVLRGGHRGTGDLIERTGTRHAQSAHTAATDSALRASGGWVSPSCRSRSETLEADCARSKSPTATPRSWSAQPGAR